MRLNDYCRAVGRDCRITTADRVVMWTMQSYTDWHTGETFVSHATIAADTCLHIDTVRRAVHRLEGHGVFSAELRSGKTTVYRFPLHPAVATATPRASAEGQISTTPRASAEGQISTPSAPASGPSAPASETLRASADLSLTNDLQDLRDDESGDDVPVAVPASVKDLLRPLPRMLYEAAQ